MPLDYTAERPDLRDSVSTNWVVQKYLQKTSSIHNITGSSHYANAGHNTRKILECARQINKTNVAPGSRCRVHGTLTADAA